MFDVTSVAKRYFPVKLAAEDEDGTIHTTTVEVGPPRLKTLEELMDVTVSSAAAKDNGAVTKNVIADLRESIKKLLNKNKAGFKVPDEYISAMDFDQMTGLLNAFFEWLNETKKAKN